MFYGRGLPYHLTVMGIFAAWAAVVAFWHWLLRRASGANVVRFAWAASDVFFLTLMLYIAADPPEPLGPLLIGYPLLIVAAGLFFRVRLVTFMTVTCLLSYAALAPHSKHFVCGSEGLYDQLAGCQIEIDAAAVLAVDVPTRERDAVSLQNILDSSDILAADPVGTNVVS
jgi:hypothetical protein